MKVKLILPELARGFAGLPATGRSYNGNDKRSHPPA